MPSIRVAGSHGFSVEFSPFLSRYLACASSENYGLRGAGSLLILENKGREHLQLRKSTKWSSGLLDVSWLRKNENLLVTCSSDGSMQLWQLFGDHASRPLTIFKEHTLDVCSVDSGSELIASGSWDSTIKLWDLSNFSSVATFKAGGCGIVHSVRWSPAYPNLIVSAADGYHLAIWDRNCFSFPINRIERERFQSLDCAWSYFEPHEIAVGGSDGAIRLWDIRRLRDPRAVMRCGGKPISRIKWSPHFSGIFAAATYDLSTEIWDADKGMLMETVRHHSGFVCGVDFNRFVPGEMADCGMDSLIHVFHPWSLLEFTHKPLLRNKL